MLTSDRWPPAQASGWPALLLEWSCQWRLRIPFGACRIWTSMLCPLRREAHAQAVGVRCTERCARHKLRRTGDWPWALPVHGGSKDALLPVDDDPIRRRLRFRVDVPATGLGARR